MSDINTPDPRVHPQAPAEGPDDASVEPQHDDASPDDDMSSYNIQPPPTEDGEVPGAPDASSALEEQGPDDPGTNATGVGV
jgi:hypothetical protein